MMDYSFIIGFLLSLLIFAPYFGYLTVKHIVSRKRKNEALRKVEQITARDSSWGR